jgi:pyrimidine-nucleoside phosphorylase
MVDLIAKKRDGNELTTEEIRYIVEGYTKGEIPDYQISALAMAIYFRDMSERERADLTMALVDSGETVDLSAIEGIKVDKHSTGGVGDTTTLILAPLVASLDIPVAKMSGRGLGHTGGTIDKLESIAGFSVELGKEEFVDKVNRHKIAIIGQTANLTPADKKLYALRDVTATVDSIPLIASSVMSKKIAGGSDAIVLDVKTGAGAFMKTLEEARALARAMVSIGNRLGRRTTAVISDMNQPLGYAVGNALEVREAIETLQGRGPKDLEELCLVLGGQMVVLSGKADSTEEAEEMLKNALRSGQALDKFREWIASQGGDPAVADDPDRLPRAAYQIEVPARDAGVVAEIVADEIGLAAMMLGAGRATKDSEIDLAVGLTLHKKIGDPVEKGEPLATIHANRESVDAIIERVRASIRVADRAEKPSLIHDVITAL